MSLQGYDEYKDSGIDWLGEVPKHWPLSRVSYLFRAGKGKHGQKLTQEFLADNAGDYPVYSGQTKDEGLMGTWNDFEFDFPDEGVLFSTTVGAKAMHLMHLSGKFSLSQNCLILWPTDTRCTVRFFYYHLQPLFVYERGKIPEHMQASFRMEDLYSYQICLPPGNEQKEISSFLDVETSKIDGLVSKQSRLIELLKEKRQAVISHAVTKGLNPNAPMRPSGIEWLGDVPEHWEVMKLRRCLLDHRQGYYSSDPYVDSGVKLLRITDLGEFGEIDITECPQIQDSEELEPFLLQSSDFVFARTGGAGRFGLIPKLLEPVIYASYLIRFRFKDRLSPNFLKLFFQASCFQCAIHKNIHGGVNQNVHAEDIKNQYVAIPPEDEQQTILSCLDIETSKFDSLLAEAERAIELLQERRAALISAAVTGKIDVRQIKLRKTA